MVDYASWDEQVEKVTELELDPKNPRIPPGLPEPVSPRAVIQELVEHDKVFVSVGLRRLAVLGPKSIEGEEIPLRR